MSTNSSAVKIAAPYARALYDLSLEKNFVHQIAPDFQNLEILLKKNPELLEYFNNPIISDEAKCETLNKLLKSQINAQTLKFLLFLVDSGRINLLDTIINSYLELIYKTAAIKTVHIESAVSLNNRQLTALIRKIKKLTNARDLNLTVIVDRSLIGGFLIKTESKVIDFTIKNQLKQLAKHLDTILEI